MKLGVLTALFAHKPLEDVLDIVQAAGLEAIELGTGSYPGSSHCDTAALLADPMELGQFRQSIEARGLQISALSCHGNPLHPIAERARASHDAFRTTVKLAQALGVGCVNLFSGCPGDSNQARYPNWVTCAWPTDYQELLEWQWREKVIPYWSQEAQFAAEHGVRLAFEMHPGFVVYNPPTLLQLRQACGEVVGANFDPSHLFWQGIDIPTAVRALGREGAIFHVHAKDTTLERSNSARAGVLDTTPLDDVGQRSWMFRTAGYGHGEDEWKAIVSALRVAGYDGAVSIEHEDALMSIEEGFRKAVAFMRRVLIEEPADKSVWWAH